MDLTDWRNWPGAPAAGAALARADVLAEGAVLSGLNGAFPFLVVRVGGALRAYVNACPHQFLPLDWRGARILSADGRNLRCANHGAGFDAATGAGVDGPGIGCALTVIPVEEVDGEIRVAQA